MGCGCSSEVRRIEPVREMVVQRTTTTCLMEPRSSIDWGAPFRTVGHVIAAPFVAMGNAFTPSYAEPVAEQTYCPTYRSRALMPVGERITTVKTVRTRTVLQPVGERIISERRCYSTLQPVGERFYYRSTLQPVGERFYYRSTLQPVGERFYYRSTLQPVGERTVIIRHHHHKKMIKPVGERFIIEKRTQKTMLKPVGERHEISKTYSKKQWSEPQK